MKIIACLGNPGTKYSRTRHNIGYIIGVSFARSLDLSPGKRMFLSECAAGRLDGTDFMMIFPQTFMNDSGTAVAQALNYYREDPWNLIVIHDEIELPFGKFDTRFSGGHRGHNGLRSIVEKTGTRDFHRLRYGVGRPENTALSVADHVLSDFREDEFAGISSHMAELHEIIRSLVKLEKEAEKDEN